MSRASWIREFYPKPANKTIKREALDHTICKWFGLLPENLKRHGLKKPPIRTSSKTCALCQHTRDPDSCAGCLFVDILDNYCNSLVDEYSPFRSWSREADAEHMLMTLLLIKEIQK